MASWRDGAAYAPHERPDGFAMPVAEPLPVAPHWTAPTPGPIAPPRGFDSPPAKPLNQIAVAERAARDPRESFAVASTMLTAEPAARKRDPRTPIITSGSSDAPGHLPPPTGDPLPPPTGLPLAADPGSWPAPAQPGDRFAYPAPTGQYPVSPADRATRQLLYIACALTFIGFVIPSTAPFVLLVGGLLAMRSLGLARTLGRLALAAGVAIIFIQIITGSLGDSSWFAAIFSLLATFGFAVAAMRKG